MPLYDDCFTHTHIHKHTWVRKYVWPTDTGYKPFIPYPIHYTILYYIYTPTQLTRKIHTRLSSLSEWRFWKCSCVLRLWQCAKFGVSRPNLTHHRTTQLWTIAIMRNIFGAQRLILKPKLECHFTGFPSEIEFFGTVPLRCSQSISLYFCLYN